MTLLVAGIGIVAIVLLVAALASGVVERAPLSYPMIFLSIGLALGSFGVLHIDSHNIVLEGVAVVTLALVLFLDAVKVQIEELKREWYVPVLTLGPGTLLTIGGIALAAYLLVNVTVEQALLLGAILASTDPVVLRDILRDERIPRSVRRALGVEAGMNDLVVLPIVLILIAVLTAQLGGVGDWIGFLARVLVLSPLLGLAVGGIGAWVMGQVDARYSVRAEYEAMYGIGLVLAAFAGGQVIQGDGFLSAFFAGFAISLFNVRLCECFMEFGEIAAEMMMLLAFVLFGVVLADLLGTIMLLPALLLAAIALGLVRPLAFTLVLSRARMSGLARAFIGWFGPRGLNSLLLALLVVQANAPDSERLLAITGAVVLVSVFLHGATAAPLARAYGRRVAAETLAEERESTFVALFDEDSEEVGLITVDELAVELMGHQPPLLLDVRSRSAYDADDTQIPSSIRVLPDQIEDWAHERPHDRLIVTYCTCQNEKTSGRVVRELKHLGFEAKALVGGYDAWKAKYPVEPKSVPAAALAVGD